MIMVGVLITWFLMLVFLLVGIISMFRIFRKAGQPGWAVLVPFYNVYIYFKVIDKPIWWLAGLLVPILNLITMVALTHALSKKFGKEIGFTLGLIFLPFIFYPILAFGSATYEGKVLDLYNEQDAVLDENLYNDLEQEEDLYDDLYEDEDDFYDTI